jgi:UDP-N-acetyl-D-mannosaminuronate dehydrogenase
MQRALNDMCKPICGSRAQLLGVAYKASVDARRRATALEVSVGLTELGVVVQYQVPYVPVVCATRRHLAIAGTCISPCTAEAQRSERFDTVVVIMHHDCFREYLALAGFEEPVVNTPHDGEVRLQGSSGWASTST